MIFILLTFFPQWKLSKKKICFFVLLVKSVNILFITRQKDLTKKQKKMTWAFELDKSHEIFLRTRICSSFFIFSIKIRGEFSFVILIQIFLFMFFSFWGNVYFIFFIFNRIYYWKQIFIFLRDIKEFWKIFLEFSHFIFVWVISLFKSRKILPSIIRKVIQILSLLRLI